MSNIKSRFASKRYLSEYLLGFFLLSFAAVDLRVGALSATGCHDGFLEFGAIFMVPVVWSIGCFGYFAIGARMRRPLLQVIARVVGVIAVLLCLSLVFTMSHSQGGSCSSIGDDGYVTVPVILNLFGYASGAAYVGAVVLRLRARS
jgi:hypothetical protein